MKSDPQQSSLKLAEFTLSYLNFKLLERRKLKNFDVEISDDIKSYMSEISIKKEFLANGSRLMDLNIPDKSLIGMVKRDGKFFIPRGNTQLLVGDRILVITDDEKALEETYEQMKGEWKM